VRIKRHYLSKRDSKKFKENLLRIYPKTFIEDVLKLGALEEAKVEDVKFYIIGGIPAFIIIEDKPIPTLQLLLKLKDLKSYGLPIVVVDMGAVSRIIKGADVMVPGIMRLEGSFNVNDIVVVIDEKYGKPIAVCTALMSYDEIIASSKGKALKNLHHIGDKLWKTLRY